jgi:hypothetical protein
MWEEFFRVLVGSLLPHFGMPLLSFIVVFEISFGGKDVIWHFAQYAFGFALQVEAIDGGWSPFFWGHGRLA